MNLENLYLDQSNAKERSVIFWGVVDDIVTPEEAERNDGWLPGIVVRGVELSFLENAGAQKGCKRTYLLPYSTYVENTDVLRIGTSVRILSTTNTGGVTGNQPTMIQFTRISNT